MKALSLNATITLSAIAFITGVARLIMEVRFVPEIMNAMPPDQPGQAVLVMLPFILLFSGWLWALLAAVRNSRRGLIALAIFNLILSIAWGFGTVIAFCPTPCPVAYPLTDIVTWLNVIVGLSAAIAIGLYLRSSIYSRDSD